MKGEDGSPFRDHLAAKLQLSAEQVISLNVAAEQFQSDMAPIDAQLQQSVAAFQKAHPSVLEGEPRPPLPPEAAYLISEMDRVTMAARDRFRLLVGEDEF